ncbi:hypothetical protein ELI49_00560 [Rhizobium ruizarguesonis]|nr:hypothetical protein ELI52_00580 [Rhizobium ruizarguesonis]TAU12702.1 hypothetical protein ELI49_00560 [Rhizobium ruizarguesonis]TAW80293.1 hypothetical protein ELI10_00560 [Rhizobium ruizarguesonis]TAX17255.1 hypothetical protein ELI09_00560 [Rhizobium ruizarguesonis]TAX22082.1 hypothetical protein ELI08_00560 [Rhizobium ruizarguesonis]
MTGRFARMAAPHPDPLPVKTGRGDVPCKRPMGNGKVAAYPLLPACGGPKDGSRPVARPRQRWRQPDEGQRHASAILRSFRD